MVLAEISTALSSLTAMKDIAQGLLSVRDTVLAQAKMIEFNDRLIEAQTSILAVNEDRTTLISRIDELEKHIAGLETWGKEKTRYHLQPISSGGIAYDLKTEEANGEPSHWICPNCYEKQKKRILQTISVGHGPTRVSYWTCNECSLKILA